MNFIVWYHEVCSCLWKIEKIKKIVGIQRTCRKEDGNKKFVKNKDFSAYNKSKVGV